MGDGQFVLSAGDLLLCFDDYLGRGVHCLLGGVGFVFSRLCGGSQLGDKRLIDLEGCSGIDYGLFSCGHLFDGICNDCFLDYYVSTSFFQFGVFGVEQYCQLSSSFGQLFVISGLVDGFFGLGDCFVQRH